MQRKIYFLTIFISLFTASVSAQSEFTFVAQTISNTAKLRSKPLATAKVVQSLKKNTKVLTTTTESKQGWYYVSVNKTKGWIHGDNIKFLDVWLTTNMPTDIPESSVPVGWYLIGSTNKTDEGYSYYYLRSSVQWNDSDLRKYGLKPDVEVWLRLVPFNSRKFAKKDKLPQNFGYSLEYLMIYCKEKRLSVENKTFYSTNDEILSVRAFSSYREPVIPNSLGETIWRKFCED